jgi:hypothetical protein
MVSSGYCSKPTEVETDDSNLDSRGVKSIKAVAMKVPGLELGSQHIAPTAAEEIAAQQAAHVMM